MGLGGEHLTRCGSWPSDGASCLCFFELFCSVQCCALVASKAPRISGFAFCCFALCVVMFVFCVSSCDSFRIKGRSIRPAHMLILLSHLLKHRCKRHMTLKGPRIKRQSMSKQHAHVLSFCFVTSTGLAN